MIISDISAQNVLKYEQLDASNLPQKGVIAIGGANESGKSTIGEIICFALFGRTFSLDFDELDKLIRWGENRCSVTLRFYLDGGDHYEIARFFDRDGNHGVRLNTVGAEDQPLARGAEAVVSGCKFGVQFQSLLIALDFSLRLIVHIPSFFKPVCGREDPSLRILS